MKVTLHYWRKDGIERVYVKGDDTDLGYFDFQTTRHERSGESYYDRHRMAKGDTTFRTWSPVTWHGEPSLLDALLPVLFGEGKASSVDGSKIVEHPLADPATMVRNPAQFFDALREKARGFEYYVAKRPKTVRDKQIAMANKDRQTRIYEVNYA